MAAYADIDDLATFMNVDVAELPKDAARMLTRAQTMLDILTDDLLQETDYASLAAEMVCNQVEYWIESGINFGMTATPDSMHAGVYSFSGGMKMISPIVYSKLVQNGLIVRGVTMG